MSITDSTSTITEECSHSTGWYGTVKFFIFKKRIFVCTDCGKVLSGKTLLSFDKDWKVRAERNRKELDEYLRQSGGTSDARIRWRIKMDNWEQQQREVTSKWFVNKIPITSNTTNPPKDIPPFTAGNGCSVGGESLSHKALSSQTIKIKNW